MRERPTGRPGRLKETSALRWGRVPSDAIARRKCFSLGVSRSKRTRKKFLSNGLRVITPRVSLGRSLLVKTGVRAEAGVARFADR